jgi:hypothetical protein
VLTKKELQQAYNIAKKRQRFRWQSVGKSGAGIAQYGMARHGSAFAWQVREITRC